MRQKGTIWTPESQDDGRSGGEQAQAAHDDRPDHHEMDVVDDGNADRQVPEGDEHELMQRGCSPPWRSRTLRREKWLMKDDEHRRRWKWTEDKQPRNPSPPKQAKGLSKGSSGSRTSASTRTLPPPTRRHGGAHSEREAPPRSRSRGRGSVITEVDEKGDVVEVEVEDLEQGTGDARVAQPMTLDAARDLWKQLQDLGDEPAHLGYPPWVLERLEATVAEYTPADISTLLAAHVQMQSLESAEVAQVLQARLDEISRQQTEHGRGDEHSLVQTTVNKAGGAGISTKDGAIESFSLQVDRMARELGDMRKARQKAAAELLRGYLSRCYGSGLGRRAMAQTLEALVGAYGQTDTDTCTDYGESPEDIAWETGWWARMVQALMKDDAEQRLQDETVVRQDSLERAASQSSGEGRSGAGAVQSMKPARVATDTQLDNTAEDMVREEEEIAAELKHLDRMALEEAIAEHEEDERRLAKEDEERWKSLQSRRLREWEDWEMGRQMGTSQAMGARLRIAISLRGQPVEPAVEVDLALGTQVGVTLSVVPGLQEQVEGKVEDRGSEASTVDMEGRPIKRPRLLDHVPRPVVEPDRLTEFLGTAEGDRVWQMWAMGQVSQEDIRRVWGSEVLEAIIASDLILRESAQEGQERQEKHT